MHSDTDSGQDEPPAKLSKPILKIKKEKPDKGGLDERRRRALGEEGEGLKRIIVLRAHARNCNVPNTDIKLINRQMNFIEMVVYVLCKIKMTISMLCWGKLS